MDVAVRRLDRDEQQAGRVEPMTSPGRGSACSFNRFPMTDYRIFPVDENGCVLGPSCVIKAHEDHEAIETARPLVDGCDVEVWQGTRIVAQLRSSNRVL